MNILLLMIPLTFIIVMVFVGAFIWAANNGQYDDLVSPAHRILDTDDLPAPTEVSANTENKSEDTSND